ncbi:MAG TPA: hypothetical protein VNI83_03865, partial [Vicinamibacterales bacterium]|nr:hypothetical protein [Vicinamibacterales bacterium]
MMRDRAFRFPFFAGPIRRDAALAAFGVAALIAGSARADAPQVYAIRGARLVTAAGAPIASGTIVFRDGVIEAVGERVDVPAEARVIDGTGLTVYPGLFDLGNTAVVELAQPEPPRNARTTEEIERWKRSVILRPQLEAAEHVKADSPDLRRLAAAGITAVLAVPPGQVFKGRSALAVTAAPEDEPQIGAPADPRRGRYVLRAPVALHVEFSERPRGQAYPVSLMGVIAFVRQTFLDARHYEQAIERYRRAPGSVERPAHDPALEALGPALAGRLPVVFDAQRVREILRALRMAAEFNLDPIIAGGLEADQVAADLKARKARVIYSLNYPTRPRSLAPDADEP